MNKKDRFLYITTLSLLCSLFIWQFQSITVCALPVISEPEQRTSIPIETNQIPDWPQGPVITAQSAILIDANSGAVLYAKNVHEKLYPASTTKLLTSLIATEQCTMDEVVTFSHDAVFDAPRDSSHIAIDVGEELTMEQCLNAILIASANEVAFGVAEHIAGTWQDFAPIMNQRAKELGCVDSNFVNPNGLPDDNHYTSSYDLAMIGRAFFANELLCKISSTKRLDIPASDKQPDHIVAESKNQLFASRPYVYEYLVGSKTGYTSAAKSSLVSCAEKDGLKLIAVVMVEDSPAQFADTVTLFNYGFSNFESINISQTETRFQIDNANFFYSDNDILGSSKPILSLNTRDCITLPKTINLENTESKITYDTQNPGQAALILYTYQNQFLGSVSVDFANNPENEYAFEEGTMQSDKEDSVVEEPNQPKVIFINIFKVLLWILGVAAFLILVIWFRSFLVNYHFEGKDRSCRRSWLKSNRKRSRKFSYRERANYNKRRRGRHLR
ncbi:MAG TPA: D-alanyl-D-alanine carboxypeptidase family protein [Lachnospiraceae bacterium]|nr:D-alanyl-D-alanine carboxypeptidase family protein [Lachnospiraceae bacterium]